MVEMPKPLPRAGGVMDPVLRDRRVWVLMAAATLTIMSNATITPALPGLERMFADHPNAALLTRLLITAPSLLVAIAAPIAGVVTDRIGRIRPLCWGLLLFSIAGTAGLYLGSLDALLISRLFLGLGVAAIMTAHAALIGDYYEGPVRARLMGYQMAAVNLGGLVFVTAAGALAAHDPRLPFAIYGLGLLVILPALRRLNETARPTPAGLRDTPRALTEPGWQLTAGLMAMAAGATFLMYYAVPTQLPYLLVSIGLDQPQQAGLVMGATMLAAAVLSVASGPLRRWLGRVGMPVTGFLLLAAGFWGMAEARTLAMQMSFAALNGAGLGLTMPAFVTTALNVTPAHRRGMISGIVTAAIFLGQFLSPLATQPLVAHLGYSGMFHVAAASYVLLGLLLYGIMRRPPPAASPPGPSRDDMQ